MTKNNFHRRNKVWIAVTTLAGACVLASPVQALELNVYGVGHLSADSVDDGNESATFIASNSSRLGFRGNQDLGNGMKAVFQIESGVDLTGQGGNDGNGGAEGDTNGVFTAARDSYAGIAGGFGMVIAGKLGGLNQWLYDYNLFGDQVGDLGNVWGASGLPGRAANAAHYRTPDFGGLSVGLSYVPDEDTTVTADASIVKADFATGGLKVGGAYAKVGEDWTVTALTASYDLGQFTVGAGAQNESDIAGISGADRSSYTVGASMKLGANGTLKAQYAVSNPDADDSDSRQLAVGYDHSLNKYTTVYVAYAKVDNDDGAAITANNYGHGDAVGVVAGNDPSALSVGLVVKFDAGF
jgi:predicted porin